MIFPRFLRDCYTEIALLVTGVIKLRSALVSLVTWECDNIRVQMRYFRFCIVLFLVGILAASQAGRFLVVDDPEKSDAIVVLAGETNFRPMRALELLRQGMAPRVFLNAETRNLIYDQQLVDIAQKYAASLPEANRISVCPIVGFSTNAEVDDVSRCLQSLDAHRVLIVTSEFHTRRSLMIFRHRLPQFQFSIAAARNAAQFGEAWWTNREWAKTTLDEWMKMLWWQAVDRWRN